MSAVTPIWPDYAVIEVPPHWLDPKVAKRGLVAITKRATDEKDLIVAIPYGEDRASDWLKFGVRAELERLIETALSL